jgi:Skp family chaperone for outer membrane proteins
MSNLQKFNTTLEDFDKEVGKLKAVSDAYQKLEGLTVAYNDISKQFDQNSKALDKINELQKAEQEKVTKSLNDLENTNKENKSELSKLLEEKTDQIRKENKEFYKDIESTIKSKLDDNKSQIKQLIESERNQIKQIFEIEFAKNTKELRQVIEIETNKQTQLLLENQKAIKISLWVIGGLTLILSAMAVFKLWTTN